MTIHLIAPENKESWPEIWHICYNSFIKTKHDICIWDDKGIENLLREDDEKFYENYLSKLHIIYQIDYVRYIILEKYGGAYFDMDVELIIDFLPLLNQETIYILEGSVGELVSNAIMISYKGSNLWQRIKTKSKFNIIQNFRYAQENPHNTVDLVGPIFLSKWISHFWNLQRRQRTSIPNIELLGYHQFNNFYSTLSFSKHYSTHVWGGTEENIAK